MPAFEIVPHPVFSPTSCVTCGSSRDDVGFVDLLVRSATGGFDEDTGRPIHDPAGAKPTIGHLYLCVTCLMQAAHTAGCLTPEKRAETDETIDAALARIAELEQQLAKEQATKLVNIDELVERLRQSAVPKPAAKAKAAAS